MLFSNQNCNVCPKFQLLYIVMALVEAQPTFLPSLLLRETFPSLKTDCFIKKPVDIDDLDRTKLIPTGPFTAGSWQVNVEAVLLQGSMSPILVPTNRGTETFPRI
jgi:hypothetical protein